jgi:hypothetical protein
MMGGIPVNTSAGKVKKLPPPAMALSTPAAKAALASSGAVVKKSAGMVTVRGRVKKPAWFLQSKKKQGGRLMLTAIILTLAGNAWHDKGIPFKKSGDNP